MAGPRAEVNPLFERLPGCVFEGVSSGRPKQGKGQVLHQVDDRLVCLKAGEDLDTAGITQDIPMETSGNLGRKVGKTGSPQRIEWASSLESLELGSRLDRLCERGETLLPELVAGETKRAKSQRRLNQESQQDRERQHQQPPQQGSQGKKDDSSCAVM